MAGFHVFLHTVKERSIPGNYYRKKKRGGFHIISGNTFAVFADIQYLILTYSNELDTT
jgi:hypothetical protein